MKPGPRASSDVQSGRVSSRRVSLAGLPNPVGVWAAELHMADVHDRVVAPASISPAAVTGDAEPACDCLEPTRLQRVSPLCNQLCCCAVTAALRGSRSRCQRGSRRGRAQASPTWSQSHVLAGDRGDGYEVAVGLGTSDGSRSATSWVRRIVGSRPSSLRMRAL